MRTRSPPPASSPPSPWKTLYELENWRRMLKFTARYRTVFVQSRCQADASSALSSGNKPAGNMTLVLLRADARPYGASLCAHIPDSTESPRLRAHALCREINQLRAARAEVFLLG